jgi:hypothetical protein
MNKKNKPKKSFFGRFWWRILLALLIIVGVVVLFLINHNKTKTSPDNTNTLITNTPISIENEVINRKRSKIESAYPELKDFESQKSFAGQSVNFLIDGDDHYFAYLVLGSGVPVAKATCFRVDHLMRVYKIGEFPDPLDSYAGYRDVNPKNCVGIK